MAWSVMFAMIGLTFGAGSRDQDVERRAPGAEARGRGLAALVARAALAQALGPSVAVEATPRGITIAARPGSFRAARRSPTVKERFQRAGKNVRVVPDPPRAYGFQARPSYRPNDPTRPTICLLHGINSTSDSFVHTIPALEAEGFGVVTYDYPFDRDLDETAAAFPGEWQAFRRRQGDAEPWALLTHSMGSLIARSYVEGDRYGNDVSHLFLIGPTNRGAAVAKGQTILQLVRGLKNVSEKRAGALLAAQEDLGASAEDLLPGSKFLTALNDRPRREGVAYHILAGDQGFLTRANRAQIESRLEVATKSGGLFAGLTRLAAAGVAPALDEMTEGTGDGCVSVASTRLDGVADHETIHANHVELIRGPLLYPDPGPVACVPFVTKRLKPRP